MSKPKNNHWEHWAASVPLVVLFLIGLLFYPGDSKPAVASHQSFIEGNYPEIRDSIVDLENIDQVFNLVFSSLGEEARVYPTENYYYFVFKVRGKEIWGNMHFPPAEEIGDYVDFAYWTFESDPMEADKIFSRYKQYGIADGLSIAPLSLLKYSVSYGGKSVAFSFNDLPQSLPVGLSLKNDEVLAGRTFDESGYAFLLIYNQSNPHFMFVLDESSRAPASPSLGGPENLQTNDAELWIGEKSGFAFYQDGNRKILVGVRTENVKRNNYYDGPFDQLADNFATDGRLSEYMQAAYPYAKGRIDKYGRFTDVEHSRLAITPYHFYYEPAELSAIINKCSVQDFYSCITYDFKEASRF
ncbi:MAG: hypothetical protein Q7S83_03325 [bacterium]|nr:hypothetical protein [bacterium]